MSLDLAGGLTPESEFGWVRTVIGDATLLVCCITQHNREMAYQKWAALYLSLGVCSESECALCLLIFGILVGEVVARPLPIGGGGMRNPKIQY